MMKRWARSVAVTILIFGSGMAWAATTADDAFPDEAPRFVGDYRGRWEKGEIIDPEIDAQVIALGGDRYRIRLVPMLDMRCPPKAVIEASASRNRIKFEGGGYYGEIRDGKITGGRREGKATFALEKVTRLSPRLGAAPPAHAIVLFGGHGLDAWEEAKGWEISDGAMMVTPKGEDIVSKQHFKDVQLHVEFRLSYMPKARGQQRSNSGVFVQDTYEVQVLDSYGLEGYYNECGALYKVSAPDVNACAPPLQWQSYDIGYRAPRFDAQGELAEHPRMTVYHNGVLIHDDREMRWITAWTERERLADPPREAGAIRLQAHGDYVQFRNIWLVELSEEE